MTALRAATTLIVALVTASCAAAPAAAPAVAVRLDHVPIAVRSLDAAVRTYRDGLGFSLKPGRPHANSISNAHIKFGDGSALELITAAEPRDELASRYLELLAHGEGGAFVGLDAGPVAPLADLLRPMALPFETTLGSYYESLVFTGTPLDYLFFIRIHARPPDLPEHLSHPNTARGLYAVWIVPDDPSPERQLFQRLGHDLRPSAASLPGGDGLHEIELASGRVYLLEPDSGSAGRPVAGATIEVADLERAMGSLQPATAASAMVGSDSRGRFIRIPPERAHGIWLEFLQPDGPGGR